MITWGDAAGLAVRRSDFEPGEALFVEAYLLPGMTIVDVGAHGGFYTLLGRRIVGRSGSVIAFEPSPRERRRLRLNLRANRFSDVRVVPYAVGDQIGETDFYVVHGLETGFGGRHRPSVPGRIESLRVEQTTLDAGLAALAVEAVDLLKLDVEGGELDVFQGAPSLLSRVPRPVVLCEISEERSASWGHRGRDVHEHLARLGYRWFATTLDGGLAEIEADDFHGNYVAVPAERMEAVQRLLRG
jgi:FkbM family methyltransferase